MSDEKAAPAKTSGPESGWSYVVIGGFAALAGAYMLAQGQDADDAGVLLYAGGFVAFLGGVLTLIGCVTVGVSTGVQHAAHVTATTSTD